MSRRHKPSNPADEAFAEGLAALSANPIFRLMIERDLLVVRDPKHASDLHLTLPTRSLAIVYSDGVIVCNSTIRETPQVWVYVLAHCMLHLGFGHLVLKERQREWNVACDCFVAHFLRNLKLGTPPKYMEEFIELLPRKSESTLYNEFVENGIPEELQSFGTGDGVLDMVCTPSERFRIRRWGQQQPDWPSMFAAGLQQAVSGAVSLVAGYPADEVREKLKSRAQRAKAWFVSSYPLLGALATSFAIIEDRAVCDRMNIGIAAVSYASREIYINPAAGLSLEECRFVIAHELLHIGLRHDLRCGNRDPYLWNVACDFVINGWLIEMEVGEMPGVGGLFDLQLRGLSAESIYDRLEVDIRRARKLQTLRNRTVLGDMMDGLSNLGYPLVNTLDDVVRCALYQGLEYHEQQGRTYLPANLVEEIRALGQPPIPWDVKLAEWFEGHFAPLEKQRTYSRLSRRQSATPDIPRPNWNTPSAAIAKRTFGVIIDTSGSMDRHVLAKALGAIASYSLANDVPAARVVFCDAAVYDQGYMPAEEIGGRVKIRGRGGTVLQPAIDFLEKAEDFPEDGPVLVITDGLCEVLRLRREHAFLIPRGARLQFPPKGEVFFME